MSRDVVPFKMRISADGSSSTVIDRGVNVTDLTRTGKIAFWQLAALFFRGRLALSWHPAAFRDGDKRLYQECTLFILVAHYDINPTFYEHVRNCLENEGVTMRTSLVGMGKSSLICRTDLIDSNTDQVLAWLKFKYVCVSRETRRSVPVPQWFVNKYTGILSTNTSIDAFQVPDIPISNVYKKSYVINPSDVDFNQHTNNTIYYRLLFDTATEASIKQHWFTSLTGDICQYNVAQSKALYLRECGMWDMIEVNVWQDKHFPDTLNCHIIKGQVVLFKALVKFYINAKL